MEYRVIRSSRKTLALEIRDGGLLVRAPLGTSDRDIALLVERYKDRIEKHLEKAAEREKATEGVKRLTFEEINALADKAMAVIPERVRYYAPLVGVTYGRITIRNQRSKWGSCSSKGNLSFNCMLMLAPPEVLDSVIVHELCHIKEMNHSDRFYREVLRVFPTYPVQHKWLKENGPRLMKMSWG